jgi:hypothetical protein
MAGKPSSCKLLSRQHHPLALTTALISSAIKKLRANNMSGLKFQSRYLWRGMKNREVSNDFLLKGGAETACMSTSSDLSVVASYARSSVPLLFRLRIDSPMEMGEPAAALGRTTAAVSSASLWLPWPPPPQGQARNWL